MCVGLLGLPSSDVWRPDTAAALESFETDRVVVGIEEGAEGDVLAASGGARVVERSKSGEFLVLRPAAGQTPADLIENLASCSAVDYAEPSRLVRSAYVPNDTYYSQQWHLQAIAAPYAWDVSSPTATVTVAVIDSGVDFAHPDLAGAVDTTNDYDFVRGDDVAEDENGHGTHVAGIIGATADNGIGVAGVSSGVTILPMKVLDAGGTGYDSDVADAITRATDAGADIINLSLGGYGQAPTSIAEAVAHALAQGVTVVAASGNSSLLIDPARGTYFYPASIPGVIAVSATRANGSIWSSSNYGDFIALAAPGDSVLSTLRSGRYGFYSGTSMAAPIVSATAALVLSNRPELTREELAEALFRSATDMGAAGRDQRYGHGQVNAGDALDAWVPDNELPGTALPATGIAGRVHSLSDPADVYSVRVPAGLSLWCSLKAATGTDIRAMAFQLGETSLTADHAAAVAASGVYPRLLSYSRAASADESCTVVVMTAGPGGWYELEWKVGRFSALSIDTSAPAAFGTSVALFGALTGAVGEPLEGQPVVIEWRKTPTSGWNPIVTLTTDPDGAFSTGVRPIAGEEYRARHAADGFLGTESTYLKLTPRAVLSRPTRPATVYVNRAFTSVVLLKPAHRVGARSVKVTWYRYESGRWRPRLSSYALNGVSSWSSTRCATRVVLKYRGRWKAVASVAGDGAHLPATASTPAFTVR